MAAKVVATVDAGGAISSVALSTLADRVKGALVGLLIADAMAMPTHWFYGGPRQIASTYKGPLKGYVAPVTHLPGSIMSKSNTGGAGRGGYKGDVIGKVIFHGKKKFWKPRADYHYHQGMQAGDNTLEGLLTRRVCNITAAAGGKFDPAALTADYIRFMTTPGTHNDTYCGTSHRMFFAKFAAGVPPKDCPDNDQHNVDTADGIVTTVPVGLIATTDAVAQADAGAMVLLTRQSKAGAAHAKMFATLLRGVVRGGAVRREVQSTAIAMGYDVRRVVETDAKRKSPDPVTACYLPSSFPSMLYMAYKYAAGDDGDACEAFRRGVVANANRGGENVATGALMGALLGAECGFRGLPKDLVAGLAAKSQHAQLLREIDSFVAAVPFASAGSPPAPKKSSSDL